MVTTSEALLLPLVK